MTEKIELLICKCEDCTHWEIGRTKRGSKGQEGFLLCKTCGLSIPLSIATVNGITRIHFDDHHMLHWAEHER